MIPKKYQWAYLAPEPKQVVEAFKHYGVLEITGKDDCPDIRQWAREIGGKVSEVYTADEIPWCGLFMAIVIKRARGAKEVVKDPLWALNWATFGEYIKGPRFGDVLVFVRKTRTGAKAGHVGLYIAEDTTHYHVLGGNQDNAVNITRIAKSRLYVARAPIYRIGKPKFVKPYQIEATGNISINEQ